MFYNQSVLEAIVSTMGPKEIVTVFMGICAIVSTIGAIRALPYYRVMLALYAKLKETGPLSEADTKLFWTSFAKFIVPFSGCMLTLFYFFVYLEVFEPLL